MTPKKKSWMLVVALLLLWLVPAAAFAQPEESPTQTPTPEELQQAEEQAQQEFEEDYANMLNGLDFSGLEYISSAGLRVLLAAQKTMSRQGKMTIRNVNETIMEVFEITGFVEILTIV